MFAISISGVSICTDIEGSDHFCLGDLENMGLPLEFSKYLYLSIIIIIV